MQDDPDQRGVAALDVGGMSVKSALVSARCVASDQRVDHVDSNGPAEAIEAAVAAIIAGHLRRGADGRVAIAFPAPFEYGAGVPRLEHKFASLFGRNLGDELRARVIAEIAPENLDVRFVNDAEAAAMGATVAGPGYAGACVLMLMVGTGLGAALVDDHRIVRHRNGVTVGELWRHRLAGSAVADDAFSARGLAAALGVAPDDLPPAIEASRAGDRGMQDVLDRWGTRFGSFVAVRAKRLDVDRVLVGGGGNGAFDLYGPALAAQLAVPVAAAPLGRDGPVIGAAVLAYPDAFTAGL